MSVLTMDMASYEVKQKDFDANVYSDEVLCSGWVPTLALQQTPDFENRAPIPEDLVTISADIFLQKMYSYQR